LVLLLVPADPLRPRRADAHFAAEAVAARDAGCDVALIDHDALAEPDGVGRAVARVPEGGGAAVYRGWMLESSRYAELASALAARGAVLRTSSAQYRRAHELPGWYRALALVTPAAAWTAGDGEQEFHAACARLGPGPAVLRDYVKSMKHYWHQAAYIPDTADRAAAWEVAARFRELREDEFTGGFVLRRYEQFTSAEARTWWVGGTCRLVTAHPDTAGDLPPDISLAPFAPLIGSLALPFVTADLALRADGTWRVIEVGDGQVSDRPASTDPAPFLDAVLAL
jgi:ATP-grasp domain, R2K clade family 3